MSSSPSTGRKSSLRTVSEEELTIAIAEHEKFIETKGRSGSRARLNFADLRGREIKGRQLREADLEEADLSGAILCQTNLENANLQSAILNGADVRGTSFRNARMKDSNLSGALGLLTKHLAGADICCSQLPEAISNFSELDNVAEASKNAAVVFIAMLAASLYSLLTVNSTRDPALVANSGATVLPFIGVALPIVPFYLVTPFILMCIYVYFHLQLIRLWELLADLPAIFPDGVSLDKKAYPWLFNGVVVSYLPRLSDRPRLWRFQRIISMFLGCWIIPLTLAFFWGSFLKRHQWGITAFHASVLIMAIYCALYFYLVAPTILRHEHHRPFRALVLVSFPGIVLVFLSMSSIFGPAHNKRMNLGKAGERTSERNQDSVKSPGITEYGSQLLTAVGFSPIADLQEANVSVKPDGWTDGEKSYEQLAGVRGAILPLSDLENAAANGAFLVRANLYCADLSGAQLERADLRGANLRYASLKSAELRGARLAMADLQDSDASYATLSETSMRYTNAQRVIFRAAMIKGTNEIWVDFRNADLTGADFRRAAQIAFVDFSNAKLNAVHFDDVQISDVKFTGNADLTDASFAKATLQNIDFTGANLDGADFDGANLYGDIEGLSVKQLRSSNGWLLVKYDAGLATKLGLPAKHFQNIEARKFKGYDFSKILGDSAIVGDLKGFDFRGAKNLQPKMFDKSRNWLLAFYDIAVLNTLGFPLDHNDRVRSKNFASYKLPDQSDLVDTPGDIHGASFHGSDLEGADLTKIDGNNALFSNTNFRRANLTGARLQTADLTGADLSNANLSGADLQYADLSAANLTEAILDGADLGATHLEHAVGLTKDQLSKAKVVKTTLLPDYLSPTEGKNRRLQKSGDPRCHIGIQQDHLEPSTKSTRKK